MAKINLVLLTALLLIQVTAPGCSPSKWLMDPHVESTPSRRGRQVTAYHSHNLVPDTVSVPDSAISACQMPAANPGQLHTTRQ